MKKASDAEEELSDDSITASSSTDDSSSETEALLVRVEDGDAVVVGEKIPTTTATMLSASNGVGGGMIITDEEELLLMRQTEDDEEMRQKVYKLAFGSMGIYTAYIYHGALEEDLFLYRSTSDDGHQKFDYVWLLQTFESFTAVIVGIILGVLVFEQQPKRTSISPFLLPGASQLFSKASTSLSLARGVSFPVVVLAKSAKIVPVMLGQLVLGGASYTMTDYLFVLLVVSGTALLCGGGESSHDNDDTTSNKTSTYTGLILLLLSLSLDGVTAGLQKRLKKQMKDQPPTAYEFLIYTNLSMMALALLISIIFTSDAVDGIRFLRDNRSCTFLLWQCCLCSAIGQAFVFYVITVFDPLVLSTVTTTRKIFSVLLSIMYKGHELTHRGIAGLVLAFLGLLIEIRNKCKHQTHYALENVGKDEQGHRRSR